MSGTSLMILAFFFIGFVLMLSACCVKANVGWKLFYGGILVWLIGIIVGIGALAIR